jgi:hypothetical protein
MTVTWNTFQVTIRFNDRLVGGIPIVPEDQRLDAYEAWARGQHVENAPGYDETLPEALAADPDMPVAVEADEIAGLTTGFRRDELGLYIEARQIKACLREAAQRLGIINAVRGSRQVLQHDLVVRATDGTQKILLGRTVPDGTDMRPISVVTRQGPRTALKRFEYVTGATITFVVKILAGGVGDGKIDEERLTDMLELAGDLGLGADRSQGEGTFTVVNIGVVD